MAQPGSFDRYHKWLGIPPREQPPNHYRLLGLGLFEDDRDVIDMVAGRQIEHVRSLALGEHTDEAKKLLNELAAARVCLLNAGKKAEYDARLRASLATPAPATPVPGPSPAPLIARPIAEHVPQAVPVVPREAPTTEHANHELPSPQTSGRGSRRKRDVQPAARLASIVIIGAAVMVAWWLFKDSQAARPTSGEGTAPQLTPPQLATADSANPAKPAAAAAKLQKQLLDLGRPKKLPNPTSAPTRRKWPTSTLKQPARNDTAEPETEDLAATVASGAGLEAAKPPPYDSALERRAAEWVLSLGGKVEVTAEGKEPVVVDDSDKLPDGPLKLIGVDLSDLQQVTDAELAKLDGLSHLVRLILGETGITSEAGAQLRAHPLLESLYVEGTAFGDEGLDDITSLTRLRSIDLTDTPTTDTGCERLAEMKSLRRIWLGSTGTTDAGVASICKLPLEGIGLEHDRVSDACTAPLLGCPTLRAVLLDDTEVTDAGVAMLLQLPKLTELGLAGTRMTMASVGALAGAKSLVSLSLSDPPISRAGHEILKAALPNCEIEWSHRTPTAKASEAGSSASQVTINEFSWSGGKRVRMEKSAFTFCFFSQISGALEGYGEGALLALNKDGYSYLGGMSGQSSFAVKAASVTIADRGHFKLPDREYAWEAGKPPLKLLRKEDGFCVLSAISGKFDGNELVRVYLDDDGYWHLGGSSTGFVRGAAMVFACRQHGTRFNVKQYHWKAGMQPVRMISQSQGFCMLSGVGGAFQGGGESVRVRVRDDGYWYLSGRSGQPSLVAEAISITFE